MQYTLMLFRNSDFDDAKLRQGVETAKLAPESVMWTADVIVSDGAEPGLIDMYLRPAMLRLRDAMWRRK